MIGILLLTKLRSFWLQNKTPWTIVGLVFTLLVTIVYGIGTGFVINKASAGEFANFTAYGIIKGIFAIIAFIMFQRMIVPFYKPQNQGFQKFYPLSPFKRYWVYVVDDFSRISFVFISLLLILCWWQLDYQKQNFLMVGFGVLISGQLVRRVIQYVIDNRLTLAGYLAVLIAISIVVVTIFNFKNIFFKYPIIGLVVPALLFVIGYYIDNQISERKGIEIKAKKREGNIYLKLIFNHKTLKTGFYFSTGFKVLFLAVNIYMIQNVGGSLIKGNGIWYFNVPFTLVIFQNCWGMWPNLWTTFELRTKGAKEMILFALKIMAFPLIVDAIITLPIFFYLYEDKHLFITVFYLTTTILLIGLGIFQSIYYPIQVMNQTGAKKGGSFWGFFVFYILMMLLTLIDGVSKWFYILVPFYVALAFYVYLIAVGDYGIKKYRIATTLLKE